MIAMEVRTGVGEGQDPVDGRSLVSCLSWLYCQESSKGYGKGRLEEDQV